MLYDLRYCASDKISICLVFVNIGETGPGLSRVKLENDDCYQLLPYERTKNCLGD